MNQFFKSVAISKAHIQYNHKNDLQFTKRLLFLGEFKII